MAQDVRDPQPVDWERLLLVYMHDPVDKALDIRGHEARAARYASRALGREVDRSEIKASASLADRLAAIAERIPMPTAGRSGERAVGPEGGRLVVRHPVGGERSVLEGLAIDESAVLDTIGGVVDGYDDPRRRYLALWRLLPERLARCLGAAFAGQPADTRVPDHTLFHHADIASGIWASRDSAHGGAYLSLSLGPVQPFIEAARTVRDLWSGSATLSWLTFQGLVPVLERFGPTALVFPALRGNPLMDLWLRGRAGLGDRVAIPQVAARRSPSIPNRFLALVPWGIDGRDGAAIARLCEDAVRAAWRRLCKDVRTCLDPDLAAIDSDWARRWQEQAEQFFDVQVTVVPERPLDDEAVAKSIGGTRSFDAVWPDAAAVRGLGIAIPVAERPGYDQASAGRWQAQLEVAARLAEAQRSIRHVPTSSGTIPSPGKCSLLGSFEQMGPDGLDDGRRFWDEARTKLAVHGVRLRARERLSAVALCKRFAAPAVLANELDLDPQDLRFPDTATVAAADWLRDARIDPNDVRRRAKAWNGRWIHQASRTAGEDGESPPPRDVWERIEAARKRNRPPAYYAIVMMDADDMGQWLAGGRAPRVRDVIHPKMLGYYERLGEPARRGLDARRPVGPALHAAISEALNDFASRVAPAVVSDYNGTTIYSGGDDVLALIPARRAVACVDALQRAFRGLGAGADGSGSSAMARDASMSAGVAFVHVTEDLRLALRAAREEEKAAKNRGKNALSLRFMRRSGEHAGALLEWCSAAWFQELVEMFGRGVTDRWAYRLRAELPTLAGETIPDAAVGAEIRRLAERAADGAEARKEGFSGAVVGSWWRDFRRAGAPRGRSAAELLNAFTLLCQGAAFVARGDHA